MLSQLLAYAAFCFFSLSFLLAKEGWALDRYCGGHARQLRLHHHFGIFAVCAILLHVVHEFSSLGASLLDFGDAALCTGWLALLLLVISFIAAWGARRFGHRIWLRFHWLMLPAVLLAALHGGLFADSGPASLALGFLVVLACLPATRHLPGQFSGHRYQAARVDSLLDGAVMLRIPGPLHTAFSSGQLVNVRFIGPGFSRSWHPLSVVSSEENRALELLIRPIGRDTRLLQGRNTVDIDISGPFLDFPNTEGKVIWIAGGIGVAPFVGMARTLGPSNQAHLLFFHRIDDPAGHPAIFDQLTAQHSGFSWRDVVHPAAGEESMTALSDALHILEDAPVLVCGPPPFVRWIRRQLRSLSVPVGRIHSNEWTI